MPVLRRRLTVSIYMCQLIWKINKKLRTHSHLFLILIEVGHFAYQGGAITVLLLLRFLGLLLPWNPPFGALSSPASFLQRSPFLILSYTQVDRESWERVIHVFKAVTKRNGKTFCNSYNEFNNTLKLHCQI